MRDKLVLVLETPLKITRFVRTICFPPSNIKSSAALVAGWGRDREGGDHSKDLNVANLQIYPAGYCNDILGDEYREGFTNDLLCGADQSRRGSGACHGDSGGPLFFFEPDTRRYSLLGTVQGSLRCGTFSSPDVYINVNRRSVRSWIMKVVRGGLFSLISL